MGGYNHGHGSDYIHGHSITELCMPLPRCARFSALLHGEQRSSHCNMPALGHAISAAYCGKEPQTTDANSGWSIAFCFDQE